ncbi:peptidylprolyl isomerase [Erythrobacter litoralis]|uniref:Parvulin-like PPIase n=1 Tax=Erythrobacter litoralis (strain HTCC2594) TaxID=314225 RepID=Q2NAA3_ERYLH|nr:peptidylprolyl isomerase [Erythrobacter litoralis]ABC63388.1 peptidyl-prolyl isomerase [Erythrobacter litoralis HTCC2594]
MINSFRRFFQSKIGIGIFVGFLALIAIAFAGADVSSTGTFGGVSGGDRVAVVGEQKVGTAELSRAASNALDQLRQNDPTLSMPAFIDQGGLERVVETLLDRIAIAEFGRKYGMRAGDNLVNSEIRRIPVFRGADGNFDEETYRAAIARQGLTDAVVRDDLGDGLIAQQVLVPGSFGATIPDKLASRYAALFKERRRGAIALIPSTSFAPDGEPTDAQVQAYYNANKGDYIRPERRVIRYATFGESAVADVGTPTAAEIANRYEQDASRYAASEERTLTQLIVPTQQAAQTFRDRVAGGASLETVAREAGLEAQQIGPIDRSEYGAQASAQVAQAVFGTARGQVAPVARSGLGWHVVRVDDVNRIEGRSLAQAREEIVSTLTQERRRRAFNELAESIEDRFADGESLADVAAEVGAEVQTTRPLTGAGIVYGTQNEQAPEILRRALATAFQMEEGEPQLTEAVPGETFMLFEASDITPSAPAPLAEIRDTVVADWKRAEGAKRARAAADRVLKRLGDGQSLAAAVRAEDASIPPIDQVNLTREQLVQRGERGVPAPLALLFSMAQGTEKKLEAPRNIGWFIVDLDSIEAGVVGRDDPLFRQAKSQFGQTFGQEYGEQLRLAIRNDVTIERNEAAIEAVRRQLTGEAQQ